MTRPLTIISSMATRGSLSELAASFTATTGRAVEVTSVGGVDAAKRLRSGEAFDVVVLASAALQMLAKEGFVAGESMAVLARSPTALAVRRSAPRPSRCDEESIKAVLFTARGIGVSSGPSGGLVRKLVADWGLGSAVVARLVEAPPGVPVASLIAAGDVDVGFQQLSELLGAPGIDIVGTIAPAIIPWTDFSVGRTPDSASGVEALIDHLVSRDAAAVFARHGLQRP